jgi:hypothetical protein
LRDEVERKNVRKFFDAKRANGYHETLQEPMGVRSVRHSDLFQDSLVCSV